MPATAAGRDGLVEFARDFAFSADSVWNVLADFGNHYWVPAVRHVEMIGEGVGAIRRLTTTDGTIVDERLDACDARTRRYGYSVIGPMPYPVDDYRVQVRVEHRSAATSRVHWRAVFRPRGMEVSEAEKAMAAVYEAIGGWLEAEVSRRLNSAE